MTTDRKKQDEAAIRALIADWSRAIEAKDPDAIVRAYTPDTILFDAIPPYRTVGAEAIAALWRQCLPFFPEVLRSEHRDLQIDIDGDLAFMHGFHRFVPEPADHPCGMTWMRVSACYRRIEGQWRIVHEHVSVPFDPMKNTPFFLSNFDKVAEALRRHQGSCRHREVRGRDAARRVELLAQAHEQGVDVQIIIEADQPKPEKDYNTADEQLVDAYALASLLSGHL